MFFYNMVYGTFHDRWLTGVCMSRERVLKIVLLVVGVIFSGLIYPLTMFVRQEPALAMMLSLYVTLGIFLLLAARDPSANRSLIAFTAWSSLAPRRAYGGAGTPQSHPTRRTVGRGCVGRHRCGSDLAGSAAVVRAGIDSRYVSVLQGTAGGMEGTDYVCNRR